MVDFRLDKKSPVPFYRQLVDMVLAGVSCGTLLPGERLPTIRELAVQLASIQHHRQGLLAVADAGVLDTQQGSGVLHPRRGRPGPCRGPEKERAVETVCPRLRRRGQLLGLTIQDMARGLAAG